MEMLGPDNDPHRVLQEMSLERLGTRDYDEYRKHQASKLPLFKDGVAANELRCRTELAERLQVSAGMSVLCLGARLGGEVRAFIDRGCFAIGLDLNPGEGNRFVVHGDFHQIQFANDSVDVIFTNSVDHVFDLDKFITEICRVLKPDGLLIMDIAKGRAAGHPPGPWESLWWQGADDILASFLGQFTALYRHGFEWPWPGEHVTLRRKE